MNVGIPTETNLADGDLIKSSLRASKERELEERIAYKAIHCPTRSHHKGMSTEKEISSMRKEIDGLRKSDELAVLSRIVDPSVVEGRILIKIVEGMNSLDPKKRDFLADETLESFDSLKAKRRLIGRLSGNPSWRIINKLHQEYTIELHKYRVTLFKKCVRVPYNEESRQLLKIFESYAGQMTTMQKENKRGNDRKRQKRQSIDNEKMDIVQFKRISALAKKEINSRREQIEQTTFRNF